MSAPAGITSTAAATSTQPQEAPPVRRPGVLRHPDFRLLWLGETTSTVGSCVTFVALPLVALTSLHTGVLAVSVLEALAWMPWLLIGLPAGAWLDRVRRRPVMMACDAVSLVLYGSIPVAAALGLLTLGQLFVVAFLSGCAQVFFSTAYRAFLPAVLDKEDLVEGNAKLQGSESAAQVAGPSLGGVLAQVFGAANGLVADAISFVVSLVCLSRMRTVEQPVVREPSRLRQDIAVGMRFVARDRFLRFTMLHGAMANMVLSSYNAIVVVFLVRELGFSPSVAGVLFALASCGGVAGALLAPRLGRRFGSARALIVIRVVSAPPALLLPLADHGWKVAFFVVATLSMDSGIVAGNVLGAGFRQAYCPRPLMARISACSSFVNFGAVPVGALLGGVLAHSLGFRPALLVILGALVANAWMMVLSPLRPLRDFPTRPTQPTH